MPFEHLNIEHLHDWMESGKKITLIDIRDPQSFTDGHIKTAQHIDNANVEQFLNAASRDMPLVVCCYHGNSSQGAADFFSQHGFKQCYSLDGGYEAWRTKYA